uniref:Uncharacterized protein n=1 Tax=Salix viminalis TaxID=40686 RepID=A0A6N2MSZ9_SALVM
MVWDSRVGNMLNRFFSLVSHFPFLSLNSGAQHDDQDHDLESNSDQSTRANSSDQNRRSFHDHIQQSSMTTMPSTSPGPPASPVEAERAVDQLAITINDSSSSSASTQTPTQENLSKENRPFHPIIETIREKELGKHTLILAAPMTIGLFSVDSLVSEPIALRVMAVSLALGVVGIWNGILLRTTWKEASNMLELLGAAFMLLAFYGFVACFLPKSLVWIPSFAGFYHFFLF